MSNVQSIKPVGLLVVIILLLIVAQDSNSDAAQMVSQPLVLWADEFDGIELDRTKWDVFRGNPAVGNGWLTLNDAEIQSKATFSCGIMQGVIQSSDWKPHSQFTDSSFGFEVWAGANGQCHHGALFKASGHLAVLRSQPDMNGSCHGDPSYQAYPTPSNWGSIRAGDVVSFTLNWRSDVVTLTVRGNAQEGQASYQGPAIPNTPLRIRLYAQPGENYKIDYVRLFGCQAIYLPIIMRQPVAISTPTSTPTPTSTTMPTSTPTPTRTATPTSLPIFSVSASAYPFQSTGVRITSGDQLEFAASGSWNCGCGPVGADGSCGTEPNSPVPSANLCALVGMVGTSPIPLAGNGFFIGGTKRITATQNGTLYLGSNDNVGRCDGVNPGSCYRDNQGSLSVLITVTGP